MPLCAGYKKANKFANMKAKSGPEESVNQKNREYFRPRGLRARERRARGDGFERESEGEEARERGSSKTRWLSSVASFMGGER